MWEGKYKQILFWVNFYLSQTIQSNPQKCQPTSLLIHTGQLANIQDSMCV